MSGPVASPTVTELTVTIAILTFRRPAQLEGCLAEVAAHIDAARTTLPGDALRGRALVPTILVVDNDPTGSASEVVERLREHSPAEIRYVVEPAPGIAAARGRAVVEAAASTVLVFIDDDERPTQSWLVPLLATWQSTGAAAVMGRVLSVFDTPLSPWVAAGEFFRRRRMATGTAITVGAAGNLLLDLEQVRQLGVAFDARLGLGAGEDSLFTRQLVRAGGLLVWCDESVATDHVPSDRMSRRWVLDRARSHGNTETVVELMLAGRNPLVVRLHAAARGAVRVTAGFARYGLGLATHSLRHQARGLRTAYRGLGIASGAAGVVVLEYSRPAAAPPASPVAVTAPETVSHGRA